MFWGGERLKAELGALISDFEFHASTAPHTA